MRNKRFEDAILISSAEKSGERNHLSRNEHTRLYGRAIVARLKACTKLKDTTTGCNLHRLCADQDILRRYVQHDHMKDAFDCFKRMQFCGVPHDHFTYSCILKACGIMRDPQLGSAIHMEIEKKGLLQVSLLLGNALIDTYVKCGVFLHAQAVFERLPVCNVVSWTAIIAGYVQEDQAIEALHHFEQMKFQGVPPDAATIVCCLKACSNILAKTKGQELHAYAKTYGLEDSNILVGTALVDMYVKCGMLAKAWEVFRSLPMHNLISWNTVIAGFAQHGNKGALECLERMKLESIIPDGATYTSSFKACGGIGATVKGVELHASMKYQNSLETNQLTGNALVDMYCKTGMLKMAQKVFDKLPARNIVTWNSLLGGYARWGEALNAFCIFDRMAREKIEANPVTCLGVLRACSHAGLVDKGQTYFLAMSERYGFIPTFEHYGCMVDLLGRAGQLDRALLMMKKTPSLVTMAMWLTLLSACQKWGNVSLERQVFEQALRLYKKEGAIYTRMLKIYK